jgi:hypothetical protein
MPITSCPPDIPEHLNGSEQKDSQDTKNMQNQVDHISAGAPGHSTLANLGSVNT